MCSAQHKNNEGNKKKQTKIKKEANNLIPKQTKVNYNTNNKTDNSKPNENKLI